MIRALDDLEKPRVSLKAQKALPLSQEGLFKPRFFRLGLVYEELLLGVAHLLPSGCGIVRSAIAHGRHGH
jgi:hypothetical protein